MPGSAFIPEEHGTGAIVSEEDKQKAQELKRRLLELQEEIDAESNVDQE